MKRSASNSTMRWGRFPLLGGEGQGEGELYFTMFAGFSLEGCQR
jgi:hypothetical protein